jgi:hypothetical protein
MLSAVGVHLLRPVREGAVTKRGRPHPPGILNIATLTPMAAATVARAFAFFNVQNPAFYQVRAVLLACAPLL